jgi:hypothetical protein
MTDDDIGSYRRDGSATMKAGAVAIGPQVKSLRARVWNILKDLGEMTDPEMVNIYRERHGGGEYRSLSTRRRELVDMGYVVNTGRTKINPKTDVQNIIWAIVSNKEYMAKKLPKPPKPEPPFFAGYFNHTK